MNAFDFAAPTSVEDAVKLLVGQNSVALSGGTDLLSRIKDQVTAPQRVVYLKDVKAVAGISGDAGSGLTIGAGTLLAAIVENRAIREAYPALWQATTEVGTLQIRNMATLGGNLLQRPRCWYYRAGNGLLAMKDGKSLVRGGDNRYHAIFMTDGNALFVNPSSLAVPLDRPRGQGDGRRARRRTDNPGRGPLPSSQERAGPRAHPGPRRDLDKGHDPRRQGQECFVRGAAEAAHDWPLILAAVNLKLDGSQPEANSMTILDSRVVIYGVAPIPWRSAGAEAVIKGKRVSLQTALAAGDAAIEGAMPLSMNAYKVSLTKTAVKRALLAAVGNRYWEF